MFVEAVNHVSLCVEDLDASLTFYCGLLGLKPIERPDFGIPGAWLDAGNSQIHLIVAPEGHDVGQPPAKPSPLANHLAFSVSDYKQTLSNLSEAGLEVIETSPEIGQLWVADPSGHIIEFSAPR